MCHQGAPSSRPCQSPPGSKHCVASGHYRPHLYVGGGVGVGGKQKKTGTSTRMRRRGKGGARGRFPRFLPPGLCKLTWPTGVGWGLGAELGSYGLCARRPRPWPPLAPVGLRGRACHPIDSLPEPPGPRPQCEATNPRVAAAPLLHGPSFRALLPGGLEQGPRPWLSGRCSALGSWCGLGTPC